MWAGSPEAGSEGRTPIAKQGSKLGLAVVRGVGRGAPRPAGRDHEPPPEACFLLGQELPTFLSRGKCSPRAGWVAGLQMQKDLVLVCIFHLHIFP